jgi:hypothetical protein
MSDLSRYRAQEEDEQSSPSDLQWLEDSIHFLGAWTKDILSPSKNSSEPVTTEVSNRKPGKITKRKQSRGRKIIRIREREIEIIIEDD